MSSKSHLLQDMVLQSIRPLVRWLIRQGVTYPSFATALKSVFLQAAHDELAQRKLSITDSALSLLSGVHRRDIRNMLRGQEPADTQTKATSLASQVVAMWLSDSRFCSAEGSSRALEWTGEDNSFEDLVKAITTDVRPRAVLEELLRLGVVREQDDQIALLHEAFVPTQDLQAMARLAQANLYDHAAAAMANLEPDATSNFLEQAVFVDEISADSAQRMHVYAARAWKTTQANVLRQATQCFEQDRAQLPPEQRSHRIRFGVYFYSEDTGVNPVGETAKSMRAKPSQSVNAQNQKAPTS